MKRFINFFKFLLSFIFLTGFVAFAEEGTNPESLDIFKDENQYIMAVSLDDGTDVSDGVEIYRSAFEWYVPLSYFSDSLGFSIKVFPKLGQADGFFISENRVFKIDLAKCTAEFSGAQEKYECDGAVVFEDEIYVRSSFLEKWFLLKLNFDSFASKLIVTPKLKLPIQLRAERERKIFKSESTKTDEDIQAELLKAQSEKPRKFGDIFFDNQIGWFERKTQAQTERSLSYSSNLTTEVMGFETSAYLTGADGKGVKNSYLNFSRKDPRGGVLGLKDLKVLELNDLQLPRESVLTDPVKGRGVFISSEPLAQSAVFSKRDFRGSLQPGWEVELYQNDLLIGRFVSDGSGEYSFKDVLTFYGLNRFRLVFYGPQGQQKDEVQNINVGPQMLKVGQVQGQLYQLTDEFSSARTFMKAQTGVTERVSAGISFMKFSNEKSNEHRQYGLLNLNSGWGSSLLSLNLIGSNDGGSALEANATSSFEKFNIGVSHAEFNKFKKAKINANDSIRSQSTLNFFTSLAPIIPVNLNLGIDQTDFLTGLNSTEVNQRSSWQWGSVYFFNTFNRNIDTQKFWGGSFTAMTRLNNWALKVGSDYERSIKNFTGEVHYSMNDLWTAQMRAKRDYLSIYDEVSLSASRLLKNTRWSGEVIGDTHHRYYVGGGVTFSGFLDSGVFRLGWSPNEISESGILHATVFLDANQNGIQDPGELPIEGVGFLVNENSAGEGTDSQGEAYLTRLPVYTSVSVRVDTKTLQDPINMRFLQPLSFIFKPGAISHGSFPVLVLTDLDGMVKADKGRGPRGVRGLKVALINSKNEKIKEVLTESDGYYYFEAIPYGRYRIQILEESRTGLMGTFEKEVLLDSTGLAEGTPDFDLKSRP